MATEAQQLVNQQTKQFGTLLNKQNQKQDALFGQYSTAVKAQPTLASVLGQAQQDRGLGELQGNIDLFQGQVADVKGLMDRLNENTSQRTAGTGANQAYLDRLRAAEGGQLNTQLGRLGAGLEPVVKAYDLASQDVGQLLSATSQDQAKALSPMEMQINSLGDRFAREITGFTQNKQNELDVLMDKLNRDRQLADREWAKAQQLASEERAYARQRQVLADEQKGRQDQLNQLLNQQKQDNTANDAQYLGRLQQLPMDERVQVIASLRNSPDPQAQARFKLGKQLGYWKF